MRNNGLKIVKQKKTTKPNPPPPLPALWGLQHVCDDCWNIFHTAEIFCLLLKMCFEYLFHY
jgi:hypothetical protein